jgi:fructose-1-phosphate kinase PfkB-like protein
MIVCVCPTATIEKNWITPNFSAGGFYRVQQERIFASGKGINVAGDQEIEGMFQGPVLLGDNGQLFCSSSRNEGLTGCWTKHAG